MFRVLVFPSCNEPGLEIIHALAKSNKITLFGGSSIDSEFDPSRQIVENYLTLPWSHDDEFDHKVRTVFEKHRIDFVFPTVDRLVSRFAGWDRCCARFITPNKTTAELVLSKSRIYARLADCVPIPRIYDHDALEFPAYAKPDEGAGAKGHRVVKNREELLGARRDGLLVTEFLPGDEYTVDCINGLDGQLLFHNIRLRGQIGRGISLGTKSVHESRITAYVRAIAKNLKIEGPWFAQFKMDRNGDPKLLEVNTRVAGSMCMTRLQGVNIPLMAVFLYAGYPVRVPATARSIVVNRHLTNLVECPPFKWVIWDLDDTLLRKDGKPDPDAVRALIDLQNREIRQLLLTKNHDAVHLLATHHIPSVFREVCCTDDKINEIGRLMDRHHVIPDECIAVNDSNTERLTFEERYPSLRGIGPESLEVLGREKVL